MVKFLFCLLVSSAIFFVVFSFVKHKIFIYSIHQSRVKYDISCEIG